MTSLQTSVKQNLNDAGYYINVGDLTGKIYGLSAAGTISTATWCNSVGFAEPLSSLKTAGSAILKDMGKTVVSSLRTFRKVQLVVKGSNSTISTFGVNGKTGTPSGEDYYTGYIEMGFEGNGAPAPVAHFGR